MPFVLKPGMLKDWPTISFLDGKDFKREKNQFSEYVEVLANKICET